MKSGWKEIRIGDLGDIITGNTPPRKRPELYGNHTIFVKATDIGIGKKYCINPEECYSEIAFEKYKKSLIPKGSTCVVTIGSIGKKIIKAHTDLFINQAMNGIVSNGSYDNDFVYYVLKFNLFQLKTFDSGTASGRENVSKFSFSNIKIQVPINIIVQKKISDILSTYDDLIEKNICRIQLLEEMARLTYDEWFVRMKFPGHENVKMDAESSLPKGWEKKKLNEIAEINERSLKKGFIGEIKYVDIASVSTGSIDSHKKYQFKDAPGRAKRILRHGDIIWSCVRPNRKSYAVVWNPEKNLIASTGFCMISPSKLPTSYLYQFLTTDKFVGYLTNLAGGAAYPAVKQIHFEEAEVVIPNNELVSDYDQLVKNNFQVIWNLKKQNQLLKEARDILLPRLMTGMIDVESLSTENIKVPHGI